MIKQDTQNTNILFEYVILFQLIYPVLIFLINVLFQNNFYILFSLFLKTFYISFILWLFLIIYFKKYLVYKLLLFLIILIFFLNNFFNLNLNKSLILLIPTLTILVQSFISFANKENFIICNKKLIYKIVLITFSFFILTGYFWHIWDVQTFRSFYRLTMPYLNPNYVSSYLVLNVALITFMIKDRYKLLIIHTLAAYALMELGSRSASLAYCIFTIFFFIPNFKKPLVYIILILSITSAIYSFKSRGDFITQHFNFDGKSESLSRYEQLGSSLASFFSFSNEGKIVDPNFMKTKKNNNEKTTKSFEKNNSDKFFHFSFGNMMGVHTNNYHNLYHFLISLCHAEKRFCLPGGLQIPVTTSYNTLSFMILNGGSLLTLYFLFFTYFLPLKQIIKQKTLAKSLYGYTTLVLLSLFIGGGFPLLEFFPGYGLLLFMFIMVKNESFTLKI